MQKALWLHLQSLKLLPGLVSGFVGTEVFAGDEKLSSPEISIFEGPDHLLEDS